MILVDTSVWVDHLRKRDDGLAKLLGSGRVAAHPFVIGELALGNLKQGQRILTLLNDLPSAPVLLSDQVLAFIDLNKLAGSGIGYVDSHLLASAVAIGPAGFWTRDKRLRAISLRLNVSVQMDS